MPDLEKKAPKKEPRRFNESAFMRTFCYVMFGVSSLALMGTMSTPGLNWRPWIVGTLIYGVLSVLMYQREERRKDMAEERRNALAMRAGNSSLDFHDDDDDDPTTPPMRNR